MTSRVVTATPEMTVQDAAKLMINNRVSGLPIVDGDRQLVGIVTEGDLLHRVETGTEPQCSRWSVDKELCGAAGKLGVDVDLVGFEATICRGDTRRQLRLMLLPPQPPDARAHADH
jgi:hypothetical protein